ncbi:MAG: exodeoxyribonuclease VII large subunit [Bacteroidales bacterium]|nr:exodeoxyribonuclease VII large subunit [Bacteroidales bacterium]
MRPDPLSLFELNHLIKNLIRDGLAPAYWVVGEISELKINASGHCYLELIEKNEKTDYIKARSRATIWSSNFRMIKPYFESSTGTALSAGIKIMVRATVDFHEVYGLSLNIIDIEPTFTVGELARQKQLIINRLTEEGVVDMNKELEFPRLPKHIAVISSKTAAGFGDFCDQLQNNDYGFKFYIKLFPAFMQGEETENSIISALEQIHRYDKYFDVAVIIRGGGSQADLASFNNYRLAVHIAQFPIPVITGIGHEQDETVTDIVAHTSLKTPTAVAEFIIGNFLEEKGLLEEYAAMLAEHAGMIVEEQKERIQQTAILFSQSARKQLSAFERFIDNKKISLAYVSRNKTESGFSAFREITKNIALLVRSKMLKSTHRLDLMKNSALQLTRSKISLVRYRLNELENRNLYLSPSEILKRGYSITRCNNRVVKDASALKEGDMLETIFYKGNRKSRVAD